MVCSVLNYESELTLKSTWLEIWKPGLSLSACLTDDLKFLDEDAVHTVISALLTKDSCLQHFAEKLDILKIQLPVELQLR